jgi:HK97 family phage major capsid protein
MDVTEVSAKYAEMIEKHATEVQDQIAKKATKNDILLVVEKSEKDMQTFIQKAILDVQQQLAAERAAEKQLSAPAWEAISKSMGVGNDDYQAGVRRGLPFALEAKNTPHDILKASATDVVSSVPVQSFSGVYQQIMRATPFIDLVPSAPLDGNAVNYARQVARDLLAAPQWGASDPSNPKNQGATKAQSDWSYIEITAGLQTIAHFVRVGRQTLDDYPGMQQMVDTEMVYGVRLAVENQLLNGTNANGQIQGIIPVATAYKTSYNVAQDQAFDTILHAIQQLNGEQLAFPTFICIHPSKWAAMQGIKDGDTANFGAYILGGPGVIAAQQLWGVPVVATHGIGVDKFLVGNMILGARQRTKGGMMVEFFAQDSDNVQRNLVTVRAEQRMLQEVHRTDAFVYGTFPA